MSILLVVAICICYTALVAASVIFFFPELLKFMYSRRRSLKVADIVLVKAASGQWVAYAGGDEGIWVGGKTDKEAIAGLVSQYAGRFGIVFKYVGDKK